MSPVGIMTEAALSVAANAVSANIFDGDLFEYVNGPALVRMRAAASAAGLLLTLILNGRTVCQDQEVSQANRWPVLPDDLVGEFPFEGGRIFATLRNRTAGALTINIVTEVIQ